MSLLNLKDRTGRKVRVIRIKGKDAYVYLLEGSASGARWLRHEYGERVHAQAGHYVHGLAGLKAAVDAGESTPRRWPPVGEWEAGLMWDVSEGGRDGHQVLTIHWFQEGANFPDDLDPYAMLSRIVAGMDCAEHAIFEAWDD